MKNSNSNFDPKILEGQISNIRSFASVGNIGPIGELYNTRISNSFLINNLGPNLKTVSSNI